MKFRGKSPASFLQADKVALQSTMFSASFIRSLSMLLPYHDYFQMPTIKKAINNRREKAFVNCPMFKLEVNGKEERQVSFLQCTESPVQFEAQLFFLFPLSWLDISPTTVTMIIDDGALKFDPNRRFNIAKDSAGLKYEFKLLHCHVSCF